MTLYSTVPGEDVVLSSGKVKVPDNFSASPVWHLARTLAALLL
jgi:hypothetical protein